MPDRRLFVALPLPEAVSDSLLDLQEGLDGARWQDADNFHITLRFVGEVTRHVARDLETALSQILLTAFTVRIAGVGHFETRKRTKAIWARIMPSPELAALREQVEQACRRAGLAAETRKFIPHVTLARLNRSSEDAGPWLARHGTFFAGAWKAEHFSLFESYLTANGSIYEEIARFR